MISRMSRLSTPTQTRAFTRAFSVTPATYTYIIPPIPKVVAPSQDVPDAATFLKLIGRNMTEYSDKFETWEDLITADSDKLKEKGIDARQRRYLLLWVEKFRRGEPLKEFKRGKKSWGGERKRKEVRAQHFGRLRAEQKANSN